MQYLADAHAWDFSRHVGLDLRWMAWAILSEKRAKEELAEVYKKVQIYNLLAGWWGIIAFIWNLMALYNNAKAKKQLDSL